MSSPTSFVHQKRLWPYPTFSECLVYLFLHGFHIHRFCFPRNDILCPFFAPDHGTHVGFRNIHAQRIVGLSLIKAQTIDRIVIGAEI